MKIRRSGNGQLQLLAKKMDEEFSATNRRMDTIEVSLNDLRKNMQGLKKDMKKQQKTSIGLMDYVIFLDDEFQNHKTDTLAHSLKG